MPVVVIGGIAYTGVAAKRIWNALPVETQSAILTESDSRVERTRDILTEAWTRFQRELRRLGEWFSPRNLRRMWGEMTSETRSPRGRVLGRSHAQTDPPRPALTATSRTRVRDRPSTIQTSCARGNERSSEHHRRQPADSNRLTGRHIGIVDPTDSEPSRQRDRPARELIVSHELQASEKPAARRRRAAGYRAGSRTNTAANRRRVVAEPRAETRRAPLDGSHEGVAAGCATGAFSSSVVRMVSRITLEAKPVEHRAGRHRQPNDAGPPAGQRHQKLDQLAELEAGPARSHHARTCRSRGSASTTAAA